MSFFLQFLKLKNQPLCTSVYHDNFWDRVTPANVWNLDDDEACRRGGEVDNDTL